MTLTLHEYPPSGNCYKIRLIAALTGKALDRKGYDILKGETRTPAFLASVNANGRIPVLQEGDRFLPESNAALFYLAQGSAYNHEPNIATVRFWVAFVGEANWSDTQRLLYPGKREQGLAALALMNDHLASRKWFVGDSPTIADLALYAYTHVADEGGFELSAFPHVQNWLARVAALPGAVPITA
jgi:glutathione S-transferase